MGATWECRDLQRLQERDPDCSRGERTQQEAGGPADAARSIILSLSEATTPLARAPDSAAPCGTSSLMFRRGDGGWWVGGRGET